MHKKLRFTLLMSVFAAPAFGQTSVTFQNGVTMLPGGGLYEGTLDTEFRADNPTESQAENETMSIDQFDAGFQTQGAIRFENLLISDGGLVPDGLAREEILFAELRLWVDSPSDAEANVDFNRIVGMDTTSGNFWQEDDTWASLGGDLIPDGAGLLDCSTPGLPDNCPIRRNNIEAAAIRDFKVMPSDVDSSDLLGAGLDAGLPVAEAVDQAFLRFDVTDAVRDWLVDGELNMGWAISNDTGDGWDFAASELVTELESEWTDAGLLPENFRPALSVIFTSGPILDLDKDGDVDVIDFDVLLDRLAVELDGPISTGALGDLDFDRDVDLDDFKFFKENFAEQNAMFPPGNGAGAGSTAAVPEPRCAVLAALALIGAAGLRLRVTA